MNIGVFSFQKILLCIFFTQHQNFSNFHQKYKFPWLEDHHALKNHFCLSLSLFIISTLCHQIVFGNIFPVLPEPYHKQDNAESPNIALKVLIGKDFQHAN